jgi:hypothetical protein
MRRFAGGASNGSRLQQQLSRRQSGSRHAAQEDGMGAELGEGEARERDTKKIGDAKDDHRLRKQGSARGIYRRAMA